MRSAEFETGLALRQMMLTHPNFKAICSKQIFMTASVKTSLAEDCPLAHQSDKIE